MNNLLENCCYSVATGQEMVRGKILLDREKSGNFIVSQGKLKFLRQIRENGSNLVRLIQYH